MVYTHEIAVLHSAFVLAEQQSHTPLHDLDKPSAKVTASQLRPTCQEIVSGLEMAHKQFQQDHWSYKLTAILLEKVLDGKQAKPDSYFYPICSVLPRIGKTLYFELIKSLKWGQWFVQCLRQVPCPVATSLLTDLFTHVQLDPDEQDLSIITTICQSLLTPSLSDQSPSNQECLHQSGGSISSERLQQMEAGLITMFFQELDNLIPFFGKGELRLKLVSSCILYTCGKLGKWKPTDLSVEDRNITQQIPSKCEQLRRMLPTDSQFLTDRKKLKKLVSRIDKMELRDSLTIHDEDIDRETSAESCVIVVEFLHKVLIKFHWLDNLDSNVLGSELVQVAITQSSVDCLVSICEEDSTTRLNSFIREVCDVLQPCVTRWNKSIPSYAAMETVAKETRVEKDGIHIQTALQKMDEKMDGYEECLDWMLNNSQELYKDPRWIDALERNVDILSSSRIVLSIAEIISTLREKQQQDSAKPEVLWTLRKVLTAAYTQLPLVSQNTVLLQVMTIYGTGLLCSGPYQDGVEGDVITAFNRMVLLGEGQGGAEDQVFSTMCGAALQAPLLFLKTAVNQAVNNTGQAGVMSKLLQVLPSLCTWTPGRDSPALLCTTLRAAAGDLRPNTREENNLLCFVENLLQPYKPPFDVTCPFHCEPLLSAPEFACLAVFPHLSQHYCHQEQQLPLITALKLLQVVLQHQGGNKNHWLQPQQVFPIMLCLCQLLEDTSALWEEDGGDHMTAQTRTVTLAALEKVQNISLELWSSESSRCDKQIAWLYTKLKQLDWTCRLHVFPVLHLGLPQLKKEVPGVLFTICNLPKADWLPLSDTLYGAGTGLVAMLECCRVSAEMAHYMTKAVTVDVEDVSQLALFQTGVTVALTQVLPQCVWQEWSCVIQAVQQLVRDGLVVGPAVQLGLKGALKVELSTSWQLAEVLQLLGSPWTETWASPSVWVHVVKNYVATIQELQQAVSQSESPPEAQLSVIGQFFCHCCSVVTVAPGEVGQQLFVLALDMLTMCQSLSKSANKETAQREKEVLRQEITKLELHGGLKRTLLLKLDGIGQL